MTFWRILRGILTFAPLALSGYNLLSWGFGIAVCGLGAAAILLEAWLERTKPEGSDGWEGLILLETIAIVGLLAGLNLVVEGGILSIVPFMVRRTEHEIGPRTAFVGATLILLAGWATGQGWLPSVGQFACAGGIAFVAWLLTRTAKVEPVYMPVPAAFAPAQPTSDEAYEEVRERYRTLRSAYRDLEHRAAAASAILPIAGWRFDDERTFASLAKLVREVAKATGAAIFLVPDARDGFTLAGSIGTTLTDEITIPVSLQSSPIVMREAAEHFLRAIEPGSTIRIETVLLTRRGRLVGLAALFEESRAVLDAGVAAIQSVAGFLGSVLHDEHASRRQRDRVAQLELLSRLSDRTSVGSAKDHAISICEDVTTQLGLDGCAIVDLTGIQPKPLATVGETVSDILTFPGGIDFRGWMGAGAPEIAIDDARDDERCDEAAALRRGIGALMVQPLISSGSLIGALVSWTAKRRGISSVAMSTLRSLTPYVLRQVFGGFASTKAGLVDPDTFWHGTQGPGSFVEIDLGRTTDGGAPKDLQEARRRLLTTAMSRLPQGGLITRRSAGTLLVFLPGYDELATARWAEAIRPYADETWEMKVDVRGESQQSRQFFERMSA